MSDRITAAWILALLTITGFSIREIRKRRRDRAWAAGAAWPLHVPTSRNGSASATRR